MWAEMVQSGRQGKPSWAERTAPGSLEGRKAFRSGVRPGQRAAGWGREEALQRHQPGGGDGEPASLGSSRNTRATQQMTQVSYRPDGGMGAEGHSGELRHWGRGVPSVDSATQGTGFAAKMTSPVGGVHSLSDSMCHRRRTRRGGVSPLIRRGVSFDLQRKSQQRLFWARALTGCWQRAERLSCLMDSLEKQG